MNKIEKMMRELCPNGIEWKKLGGSVKIWTTNKIYCNKY